MCSVTVRLIALSRAAFLCLLFILLATATQIVPVHYLKVLFSEMDLAESRFTRYAIIKGWGGEVSEKAARSPSCESPLKFRAPPCFLVGCLETIANYAPSSVCGLLFTTYTAVGNGAMNKFGNCSQWRSELLIPRMLLFSVGNSSMTAPRYWQRHNELVSDIGNGTQTGDSTHKMGNSVHPLKKPTHIYPTTWWIFIHALAICFQVANSSTRWRCRFTGLSQDGRADFCLKTSESFSLIKTFRMNII